MAQPELQDAVGVFLKTVNGEEVKPVLVESNTSFNRLAELGAQVAKIDQSWVDRVIKDAVRLGRLNPPVEKLSS